MIVICNYFVNFCPECGTKSLVAQPKFCFACGTRLYIDDKSTDINTEIPAVSPDSVSQQECPLSPTHVFGIRLEEMVERILRSRGYTTERRKKIQGRSGAFHELDLYARSSRGVLAVECKNYDESRIIGIKELRDLYSKTIEIGGINEVIFVTTSEFSSESNTYAAQYNISLWDGKRLREEFFKLNLGRVPTNSEETVIEKMLPLSVSFENASRFEVMNDRALSSMEATLLLKPYYIVDCTVETRKFFKSFQTGGLFIIDAINKDLTTVKTHRSILKSLSMSKNIVDESKELIDDAKQIISESGEVIADIKNMFKPKDKPAKASGEVIPDLRLQEKSQIISDLTLLRPQEQTVIQSGGKYIIEKLSPKISNSDAEQIIFEHIKKQNNLQFEKVTSTKSRSAIRYIPKWLVKFKTISNLYIREILATSKKVIMDDTLFCQSDSHANQSAYPIDKRRAICEVCGKIFCRFHILRSNELYVCEQHQKGNIPQSLDNINPLLNKPVT